MAGGKTGGHSDEQPANFDPVPPRSAPALALAVLDWSGKKTIERHGLSFVPTRSQNNRPVFVLV